MPKSNFLQNSRTIELHLQLNPRSSLFAINVITNNILTHLSFSENEQTLFDESVILFAAVCLLF